jgi:hypothetical protein
MRRESWLRGSWYASRCPYYLPGDPAGAAEDLRVRAVQEVIAARDELRLEAQQRFPRR